MKEIDLTLVERTIGDIEDHLTVVGGSLETLILYADRLPEDQKRELLASAARHANELLQVVKVLEHQARN